MKSRMRKICLPVALCVILLIAATVCACGSDDPAKTGTDATGTDAGSVQTALDASDGENGTVVTDAQTSQTPGEDGTQPEPASQVDSETSPDADGTVGEDATVTDTEPEPVVINPADLDFSTLTGVDLADCFERTKHCKVSVVEDGEDAGCVRLGALGATSSYQTPYAYLNYAKLCGALKTDPADMTSLPVLLLKVKSSRLTSHTVRVNGAASVRDTDSNMVTKVCNVKDNGEWQYVWFDFSSCDDRSNYKMFLISFEIFALTDEDYMIVGGMKLCSSEELAAMNFSNTYPIDQEQSDGKIKLLQFNVQQENGSTTPLSIRADLLKTYVDTVRPDIVGLQEVSTNWYVKLRQDVFNDSYAYVGEPRTAGSEANPIFYRQDKYELVASGTFWLSDTPDVPGSALDGVNYPRICTWVHLKDRQTGFEFLHFNTHFDHNGNNTSSVGNQIRAEQTVILLSYTSGLGDLPAFLTGDLNNMRLNSKGNEYAFYQYITGHAAAEDAEGNPISGRFSDSRLDAPITVDEDHLATMTKYYDENDSAYNPSRQPIDYVFYTADSLKALSYTTTIQIYNGLDVSDHLSVYCEFEILNR